MAVGTTDVSVGLQLLGSAALTVDGEPVSLASRRTTALLAYLACQRRPVRREVLCELLWDDQTSARKNLRVLLSNLRRTLPGHVQVDREQAGLDRAGIDRAGIDVDVDRFEQAATAGRSGGPADLRSAAMLYNGEFLDGLELGDATEFSLWRERERDRLRSLAITVHEQIALAALDDGDLDAALEFGRRMLELDPADETATRVLMEGLARTGRRSEALAVFETCRTLIVDELGLTLFTETQELADAVRQGRFGSARARLVPPLLDPDADPDAGRETWASAGLVGRSELIRDSRRRIGGGILTFTGRGGVGKTALAAEVVRTSGRAPVVVDLVPLDDLDRIADAALTALGLLGSAPDPWTTLAESLSGRPTVLVFDRAEHLGSDFGHHLSELVRSAPGVGVVVTSRAALRAPGERVIPVPPLDVPHADTSDPDSIRATPAVELFLARADEAGHEVVETDLPSVGAICRRLDGLPLAIELAVPLLSAYSVAGLRTRLERPDGDAAGLLSMPTSDGDRGLEATITRSYDLLSDEGRTVFRRLSVFDGPFDFDAAAAAVGEQDAAISRAVPRLTELHLVERVPGAADDLLRLPNTIRDTARNLLLHWGEADETVVRHLEHFRTMAAVAARELEGPDEVAWLHRLDARAADLRAVLDELVRSGRSDEALAMTVDLGPFWLHGGRAAEGCERLEVLIVAAPLSDRASLARQWVARLRVDLREDEADVARAAARALADEVEQMAADDETHVRLRAMSMLGHALNLAGDDDRAREVTSAAIDEARRASSWWLPELLHRSALFASIDGRVDDALCDAHEAYEFARRMGNGHMEVQSLLSLIQLPGHEQLGLALPDLRDALDLARSIGDRRSEGWIVASLGAVAIFDGDVEMAAAWFLDGVQSSLRSGSRQSTWFNLMGAAAVAGLDGERLFAARIHGAVVPRLLQLRREMPAEYVDVYVTLMADVDSASDTAAAVAAGSGLSARSALTEADAYLRRRPRPDKQAELVEV